MSAPAGAQIRPPSDTTGMIVTEGILETTRLTGAPDTTGFRVYPDTTVAVFSYGGTDTVYADYGTLVFLGLALDELVNQNEIQQPYLATEIIDGEVHLFVGRAIPLPLAATLVLVVLLLVTALIVYLARRLRQEKRQRSLLEEATRQIAASREGERLRLAREIHDGPLQDLHALHMQLGLAADALSQSGETEARRVRGSQDEAHTVIGDLRGIMEALRPPAIGPFGLAAALRSHAEQFQRRYPGIRLDLDLDEDGLALPEATRLVLFRIAQESLNNAAKHAAPSQVRLTFRLGQENATVTIADDGSGLVETPDTRALAAEGHYGFLGMQERASSVGGQLEVEGHQGGGTRISVRVPRRE